MSDALSPPPPLGQNTKRIMFLGDIVGTPGRQAVAQLLPGLRESYQPNLVIANGENAANGSGLTRTLYQKIIRSGVDAITLGDHVYKKVQITSTLESESNITRPANLSEKAVGRKMMALPLNGFDEDGKPRGPMLYVITVLGRVFQSLPVSDPFACVEKLIDSIPEARPMVFLEVHAEATSEKLAMSRYFDGKVVACVGTHTHVPTADACIWPGGTAHITDVGMCGPHDSIIGRQVDRVLHFMTTSMPAPFDVAQGDPRLNGVVIDFDMQSRQALRIERIEAKADISKPPFSDNS